MDSQETSSVCASCRLPKATQSCEICLDPLCKKCTEYLSEERVSFWAEKPPLLEFSRFCARCFDQNIAPELSRYDEWLEKAKDVAVLMKSYKGQIPLLRKAKVEVRAEDCEDRAQVILRLAFQAAVQGYNSLVQTDVEGEKVRNAGYQKTRWRGVAFPAEIDSEKLDLQEYREEVWRRGH